MFLENGLERCHQATRLVLQQDFRTPDRVSFLVRDMNESTLANS